MENLVFAREKAAKPRIALFGVPGALTVAREVEDALGRIKDETCHG